MDYEKYIRVIENFPQPGISFKDVSPLLADRQAFASAVADMATLAGGFRPTVIVGPEARGFIFGTPVANRLKTGFVMARKEGKLPEPTVSIGYGLEYGTDTICISEGLIKPADRVVIVDDLLATGGTLVALTELIRRSGAEVVGAICFIELAGVGGARALEDVGVPFKACLRL